MCKNPAIYIPGGESNLTAKKRALSFLQDLEKLHQNEHIIISSHGNLVCILLNYFDDTINYNFWKQLPMPVVLVLKDDKIYLQWNLSLFYFLQIITFFTSEILKSDKKDLRIFILQIYSFTTAFWYIFSKLIKALTKV